jgi:nitrogen-specific signal transduction histidine kinase
MSDTKIYENQEVGDFFNSTLKEIMSACKAECGSLFLFDRNNKELILESLYNSVNINDVKGLKQRVGEGIAGKVVDIKNAVLVTNIDQDLRFRSNGFNHYRTKSFMSIPLFSPKGLIGVINIVDKKNGQAFDESDLNIANSICKYACLAVDRLITYANLKQEKEISDRKNLLLEKYASVGKLAGGIVHEINNPLDGVIRYTNLLLEQPENSTVTYEYLAEIKKGLTRIANITKSLLDFSYQLNNQHNQDKKYVRLNTMIEESLRCVSEKSRERINVVKQYKEGLPRIMDFGLSHLFVNIIKNAFDAMGESGVLTVTTCLQDSAVRISFHDTGPGIPEEIKESIFEPFFTTKDMGKGTGLGLAISNEIINKYGGRIELQSAIGKGSSFNVLIPKKYLENA